MSPKKRPQCAAVITFDGEGGMPCTFRCQVAEGHQSRHRADGRLGPGTPGFLPYTVHWSRNAESWYREEEA